MRVMSLKLKGEARFEEGRPSDRSERQPPLPPPPLLQGMCSFICPSRMTRDEVLRCRQEGSFASGRALVAPHEIARKASSHFAAATENQGVCRWRCEQGKDKRER